MILDTSALVAILYGEPQARDFVERIRAADVCRISVANHVELSMVVESQLGPDGARQSEAFLRHAGVIVEPVTLEHRALARQAFLDFGRVATRRLPTSAIVSPTRSPERQAKRSCSRETISP